MIKRLLLCFVGTLFVALQAQALVKENAAKPVVKGTRASTKAASTAPVHEAHAPVVLSAEQLAIAEKVFVGTSQCELAVVVTMRSDESSAGRFLLDIGHRRYTLLPVATSTGAVRLEDAASGAVWLQLANKSMLMNQKLGQRMADDCMSPQQRLVAQALLRAPAPHLLDAPKDALVPFAPGKTAQEMVPNTTE